MKIILTFILAFIIVNTSYEQAGAPDLTFGTNGRVAVLLKPAKNETAITADKIIQIPSGGLLVASSTYNNDISYGNHVYLTRFKKDGALDKGFGKNGKLNVFPDTLYFNIASFAIDSAGRIIVITDESWLVPGALPVMARYKPNGSGLDSSFGINGTIKLQNPQYMQYNFKPQYDALAILPGNKILTSVQGYVNNKVQCVLLRFNSDGSPDKTFNGKGYNSFHPASTGAGGGNYYTNTQPLGIQPDGKILVTSLDIARFNNDGTRDMSFGINGLVKCNTSGSSREILHDLSVLPNGKFMYLGSLTIFDGDGGGKSIDKVYRYTKNGKPDSSFATNGSLTVYDYYFGYFPPSVGCLTVQPDNKFLVSNVPPEEDYTNSVVTRYLSNGQIDNSFANNGNLANPSTPYSSILVSRVLLQRDNKIVTLAYPLYGISDSGYYYISRYLNNRRNTFASGNSAYENNIQANKTLPSIFLKPNPATDNITVTGLSANEKSEISIVNAQGKTITLIQVQGTQRTIDIQRLPAGMYYVIISRDNTIIAKRSFIKQ